MILDSIKEDLPKDAMISDVSYEGSEIILYTKSKDFFNDSTDLIKKIVNKVKKRIEVRADQSIVMNEEKTVELIKKLIPEEAGVKDIYFEPEFAKVVIHAEKPGLVIGKSGETLLSIKKKTFWTPDIKRAPVIDSELIRSIRKMLHKEAGYRKKFLNKVGEKIYSEGKDVEWIRVTGLGSFREVGRSCILLQTPQTRVMLDCGMAVSLTASKPYPYLDASEFNIQTLDAVILTHAHMDHCLPPQTPVVMADGSKKPIKDVSEGDEILSMNFETGKWETGKCVGKTSTTGHKAIKKIKTPFRIIEASPNHRFFTVRNLEIAETEAQDLTIGNLLPINIRGCEEEKSRVVLNTNIEYDKRRMDSVILPDNIDEKLASLIGYMQGDGHFRSESSIRVTDADKDLLEFYKNLVQQTFGYTPLIRHHSDKSKNAWVLEINNAKIVRFLKENFLKVLTKTLEREVPEKILNSGMGIKASYLRGLMDAEGSVSPNKSKIRFTSLSKKLLNQANALMADVGVRCTLDKKYYTLHISSLSNIRRFAEIIGFNSAKKYKKMTILANKESLLEKDLVPINSDDLKRVINDARLFGRIHNSPNFRENLSLYDWLNRSEKSYCTRRTALSLIELLESRIFELRQIETESKETGLKDVRQALSISLCSISEEIDIPAHVLQYRESGYIDHIHGLLSSLLHEKLANAIRLTQQNIEKVRKILTISVVWEQITQIETLENPYSELIDIEVLPHRNFVAEGIIVHNCGMVPYLYEYGYRGPVYCTRPTRDIAALMQLDYIQICQRENRKAFYSSKGIEESIRHCIPLEYGEVTDIAPDMRITFQNAGHLLGSSSVHIHIGDGLYNLVYSLDWTVPVVLINPEGHVIIEPIGKIIDNAMDSEAVISDGFVERAANSKDWKAVSFNPSTLKAEIVPITSFMRHPITEKLYRIRTTGGKETIVTASHNVFQVINGEVKPVKTKDLTPGQFIVTAKHVPVEKKEAVIDLTPYKHELRLRHAEGEIQQKLYEIKERATALFPEKHEKILEWASEHYSGSFAYQIAKKHKIRAKTIREALDKLGIPKHPRRLHLMPSKLKITPKLARFLGYFVAEGSSGRNEVRITNYDKKILNDCIDIIKTEFGIDGVIHKNDAIFCSRQLEFLLKIILGCGDNAFSKRVPKLILNSPEEIVWEFLHGYYEGDGCFRVRPTGLCVSANSKSPELIREISLLLARFGIVPSLEFNASSEMYMAHVNSREHIETLLGNLGIKKWEEKINGKNAIKIRAGMNERLPLNALSEQAQVRVQKSSYQSASSASLLMLPKIANLQEIDQKLMNSCFAFAKILSIEEVESTSEYVYDLSIEGYENFLTGQGMIFVHNTGDIKYENTKLFEKAFTDYTRAEAVIIESTYGSNEDRTPSHKDGEMALVQHVRKTLERGGRVLIPSFAVGRSQDVISILVETDIQVPIYLDGMVWDTTAIHTAYPEFMSKYIQTLILHKSKNPFIDSRLRGIGSQKEREQVLNSTEPAVIISTSGMLMGGPAIEYLQNMANDPKDMLLFVGYQAEGTLGRRIQKGWKEIQLDNGKMLDLKLEVQTVSGLGGHSDQQQLLSYLQHFKNKPRKIIVNHGDGTAAVEFARNIHKLYRIESVAPRDLETIRLR